MARAQLTNVYARDTAEGFSGMDRSRIDGTAGTAWDVCNFRLLDDGSLEKREGYRRLSTLPEEIRGVWAGNVSGKETLLAAAGSHVYLVAQEGESSDEAVVLAELGSESGIANFFYAEGCVYMLDGVGIYCYDGSSMSESEGYAPLYGYGWHPHNGGAVNEPLNAFSRHVRIHFSLSISVTSLSLKLPFESIEAVYHSNGRILADYYTLSEDGLTLSFDDYIESGLSLTVYGTLREEVDNGNAVRSCSGVVTMGGEFDDRIFLYHGDAPADIYVSKTVSEDQLVQVRLIWPSVKKVYFSAADKLTVDDGNSEVTALCRHYDRLLVFRRDGTCMADLTEGADGSIYPAMPVNSSVGCTSPEALCQYGNDPITVSERGIYRWLQTTDERDECNAVCVSDKVAPMLSGEICRRIRSVCWRERHEVWFYDPEDSEGGVLVWRPDKNAWVRFSGIVAQGCLLYAGDMCFYHGCHIYRFAQDCLWDKPYGEQREITAHCEAVGLHLGRPWEVKRMGRCLVSHSGGGELEVTLTTDRGAVRAFRLIGTETAPIRMTSRRVSVGRFVHLTCRIASAGAGKVRLWGLTLTAGK